MVHWQARIGLMLSLFLGALALSGCGHMDDEWQQKLREIAKLQADLDAANKRHTDDEAQYAQDQQTIQDLQGKMKDLGLGLSKSEEEKAKLKTAMAEYEARLKQLDDMKARFRDLKSRLDKLTGAGLNVGIRHNKMVIQLPGDVLFDSGKDSLKPDGKKILKQVADIIKADTTLSVRDFQVAGHTDKEPYGGQFLDNWGLSLMRARTVLVFLISPDKGADARGIPTGGALDPNHFAAAGYGAVDPASGSVDQQTRDDEQKNRRVELVLQPDVAEMLNLKEVTGTPATPGGS
jgi:chemotaxis protein MotB